MSEITHPVFTRTRPRSTSPMMRAAQALRQQLSRPVFQSADPAVAGTATAPANAALSQLLYMGTREACAEAARASVAGAERAQVGQPRRSWLAEGPASCSGRGWPGDLRRQVAAERDPRAEDFFDRLARAEARDQAARIPIEAALTTSAAGALPPRAVVSRPTQLSSGHPAHRRCCTGRGTATLHDAYDEGRAGAAAAVWLTPGRRTAETGCDAQPIYGGGERRARWRRLTRRRRPSLSLHSPRPRRRKCKAARPSRLSWRVASSAQKLSWSSPSPPGRPEKSPSRNKATGEPTSTRRPPLTIHLSLWHSR